MLTAALERRAIPRVGESEIDQVDTFENERSRGDTEAG